MTDRRRHSVAEIVPPTPHSKDKKKWSFDSFSPLHLGFTLPSKWKRKSSADGIDPRLRKHADDHDLLVKPSLGHRSKRRASVAVIATETTCTLEKSSHHHGSFLSLWKRRSSIQVEQTVTVEQKNSPEEERPRSEVPRRRASIAVPHLNIPEHKIIFKSPKSKSKKHSKEYFLAVVYLTNGDIRWLSGEDGIGIAELLTQATMDQRINSYRLIMASTRAILDSDGSSGSPCVDPDLDDVFEELGLQNDQEEEEDDPRYDVVNDLQKTEREYCRLLRSILNTYGEPLRKFSSLTAEDHKVLFVGIEPILSISAMLTSKFEDVLKTWDSSASQIGNLFSSKFWNLYEDYLKNYSKARKLLEDRCTEDQSFLEFCNLRKGQTTYNLQTLLHLPVSTLFYLIKSLCCPLHTCYMEEIKVL